MALKTKYLSCPKCGEVYNPLMGEHECPGSSFKCWTPPDSENDGDGKHHSVISAKSAAAAARHYADEACEEPPEPMEVIVMDAVGRKRRFYLEPEVTVEWSLEDTTRKEDTPKDV